MANKPKAGLGGIIGVIIGAVVVGGIAGTPLYLRHLESHDRALKAAAREDVELIRRIVINLDGHLAALADADALRAEDERLTPQIADEIKATRSDVFGTHLTNSLSQTLQLLRETEAKDNQRSIRHSTEASSQGGLLGAGAAVTEVRREHFQTVAKLRSEADSAMSRLRTITRGQDTAGGLLEVTRVQALYYLVTGQLSANRGDLERQLSSTTQSAALQRLTHIAQLQRELTANETRNPATAIADITARIDALSSQLTAAEEVLETLRPSVAAIASRIADHETAAAEAWTTLGEIDLRSVTPGSSTEARYLKLAAAARQAEAHAAALRTGAANASPAEDGTDESDGRPAQRAQSLDELRLRLQQVEEASAVLLNSRQLLESQRQHLVDRAGDLAAQRSSLQEVIAERHAELRGLLQETDTHAERAQKAYAESLATYKLADGAAQAALRAAKARKARAADQARTSGGSTDERLELITKDADTEASAECLAGEIAFAMAMVHAKEVETLKTRQAVGMLSARLLGTEPPASADAPIESARQEAGKRLAEAAKHYESAEKLLASASTKTAAASLTGANYVWTMHVGQASVHLLRASLAASVDGQPDRESIDQAYALLTKVAEGREQSPLVSTALATLAYLQRTAQ